MTGSASINRNRYIHFGTRRIAHLRMRPMSLYESSYSTGAISLKDICYGKASDLFTGEINLETIINYILRGGWSVSIGMRQEQAILIAREYLKSFLIEDIYKVDDAKRDQHKVELLLRSLARNESTTATDSTLKKDIIEKDYDDTSI